MALNEHDIESLTGSQEHFEAYVREHLRQAVRVALMNVLEEEVEAVISAQRYERTEQRRDQRNGHYTRTLDTAWDRFRICLFLELDMDIKPRCSNALIVAVTRWIRPLEQCLWVG